jgi:hypothetical protein
MNENEYGEFGPPKGDPAPPDEEGPAAGQHNITHETAGVGEEGHAAGGVIGHEEE